MSPPNLALPPAPPALSYELFPPRTPAAADSLWETIRALESTHPDYVSVTYGASGSNRDTAVSLLRQLLQETSLRPLAHLTCIGNTAQELALLIAELLDHGVRGILALRGDRAPSQTRASEQPDERGLLHAQDLVELIRRVEQRRSALLAAGKLAIGVAAYPAKHPESPDSAHDIEVLLAKQRSGADFAITQVFFHPAEYEDLLSRAQRAGVSIPIIPGLMPLTSLVRLRRLAELSGAAPDEALLAELAAVDDDATRRRIGVAATVRLARVALEAGAPGIHLYTFNEHRSALDVLERLDLPRPAA
ncbi:methylenetetrahydrofolate reductase [Acaricomes phytoseiuli]|uniref:methylenetetrahydrofolate reductase n=1 Tax=Acaricomes phytoseiuli TaxID=291968 RepID=UPI002221CB31|nr:methylenetetrahydrofolate reductase [Acaricomes phytoseiuli]MCW1249309.1 methylenetetrahydrofolate reductase [Acaricomes phytoseiuli]